MAAIQSNGAEKGLRMTVPRLQLRSSRTLQPWETSLESERWFTWILAAWACTSILVLRLQPSSYPAILTTEWLLVVAVSALLRAATVYRFRKPGSVKTVFAPVADATSRLRWLGNPSLQYTLALCLVAYPLVSKWILAPMVGDAGEAIELVWLTILQNVALCVAAFAKTSKQHWITILLSSFLILFGLASSDRNEVVFLIAVYGIMIAWWLMTRHWQTLERGFVASDSVPFVRLRIIAISSIVLVVAMIGGIVLRNGAIATSLDGFMPTSGGNQGADDAARQGVGNGEMLVAAKDQAFTFGPVDSELFLESQLPTLYDLASDVFGEAVKKNQLQQQTVAINANIQEASKEASESKKSGKEFSTVRSKTTKSKPDSMDGTKSRALLFLIGRTPLHLKMEAFDRFDGREWLQSDLVQRKEQGIRPKLETRNAKPWMRYAYYPRGLVRSTDEPIAIKLIGYRSARIVSPSLLTACHIDQVDQPEFFGWTADGQPEMRNREFIPQLTVLREEYSIPNLHLLRHEASGYAKVSAGEGDRSLLESYLQVPAGRDSLREEALRRAGAAEIGTWRGVEAIVESIRQEGAYSPDERVPAECSNVVEHFLQQRKGPDYLFATTAAMLLRSVDVPCRLVSGFYARPDNFNLRAGQTEVFPEDLHTWIEVYVNGMWIPVETTPGFESPQEFRTWIQWAMETLWWWRDRMLEHPFRFVLWAALIGWVIIVRHRIIDGMITAVWFMLSWRSLEGRIRSTLGLIRWRAWLYRPSLTRSPQSSGITFARWLRGQFDAWKSPLSMHERQLFVEAIQRMIYAPSSAKTTWMSDHKKSLTAICYRIALGGRFFNSVDHRMSERPS